MEIGLLSFDFHSLIIAHRHVGNGDLRVMLAEHNGPLRCANDPFRLCPHSVIPSSQHVHTAHKYILPEPTSDLFQRNLRIKLFK